MEYIIPKKVALAIAAMKLKGVDSWVIGGAVRDTLLGRDVHDWDLTAAGTPEEILRALPDAKPIGGVFGTVSWHGVEITPCRAESDYTDHRHPDTITFGIDLRVDLSRRDFTINAMAWDGQTVIDPYRGRYDLKDKILRAVGDPALRFTEDALRILRLYRFAGTLGFAVDEATAAAALARADTLALVSAPRVRGELDKALHGAHPSALAPLIAAGGLEHFGIARDACATLHTLDSVPPSILCRWWALFRLTHSNAFRAGKIFDFGRSFVKDFALLDTLFASGMPEDMHALKKTLSNGVPFSFLDAADTFAAIDARFAALPDCYRALVDSGEPYLKEHLAITPTALMAIGITGRKLGEVQRCLVKAVIDTPALNDERMLAELALTLKTLV